MDEFPNDGFSDEEEEVQTPLILSAHVVHSDPTSFDEELNEEKWRATMDVEMRSIEKNVTWISGSFREERKK